MFKRCGEYFIYSIVFYKSIGFCQMGLEMWYFVEKKKKMGEKLNTKLNSVWAIVIDGDQEKENLQFLQLFLGKTPSQAAG